MFKVFLCDSQDADRQAILYVDRSFFPGQESLKFCDIFLSGKPGNDLKNQGKVRELEN